MRPPLARNVPTIFPLRWLPLASSANVLRTQNDEFEGAGWLLDMVILTITAYIPGGKTIVDPVRRSEVELLLRGMGPPRVQTMPNPWVPSDPVGPVGPTSPVAPVGPVGPTSPVAPVGPTSPVAPVGPVGPTSPVGPVGPTSPVGPVGPTSPDAPVGPTAPDAPVGPSSRSEEHTADLSSLMCSSY